MKEHVNNTSNNETQAEERVLMQLVAEGSRESFAILHKRYHPKLYQYILTFLNNDGVEAEEVLQETFINIWKKRETLFAVQHFEAYIRRSVKNRILNRLKHQEFQQRLSKSIEQRSNKNIHEVEEVLQYNEYFKIAQEAISKLPSKRKLIFLMSTEEGMSLDDIAISMNVSKSRVKQQLYNAIAYIKLYLKKHAAWVFVLLFSFFF
jgi:RNA polymerase sigma-70 factor (ECF subfamily)